MDLICFCHIRWNFVYQRPQHLLNRFAINHRVFVIEEPVYEEDSTSCFYEITKVDENTNLWVVSLHIPQNTDLYKRERLLKALINGFMRAEEINKYILWYYSPMALTYSEQLKPELLVYDCMDELSAFKFAPPELKKMEVRLLGLADIVFTGGESLYEAKKHLHHNIHSFPSSIDKSHFGQARIFKSDPKDQAEIPHPRFGFYGVIDERFHIGLIEELSVRQPDWHFVLVGPVIKIDPALLPKNKNVHYLGGKDYKDLPSYLAGWDVAILPFELNDSTKFISPTKTPEYLAGGKPVISTSITDVVTPYAKLGLVSVADNADEFILAANEILKNKNRDEWLKNVDEFLANISWNKTWKKMADLISGLLEEKLLSHPKKTKVYV